MDSRRPGQLTHQQQHNAEPPQQQAVVSPSHHQQVQPRVGASLQQRQPLAPIACNDAEPVESSQRAPEVDLRNGIDPGDPLTKQGRAKKRKQGQEEDGEVDPNDPERYRYKAYHIRRAFTLYGRIPSIINNGIKRRAKLAAGEDVTDIQNDNDYESFLSILGHLEGLNHDINRLKHHPKMFRKLIRSIREAADQARNNDTANLKKDISCMLTADGQSVLKAVKRGLKASSKNDRGFENDVMGRYLCPISLDWDDLSVREEIRDGQHAIHADDWPRLLYANLDCNLDDMEAGLGRNIALVRVVKYLFTGRSSAFSDTAGGKTTRSGNAVLAGMKEITPKIVAYGACMLRFALSTEESWSKLDKEFNSEEFYWHVVGIFEESGQFGKDLLAWWNLQVFGTSQQTSRLEAPPPPTSSISLLRSQRAAKRARQSEPDGDEDHRASQQNPSQNLVQNFASPVPRRNQAPSYVHPSRHVSARLPSPHVIPFGLVPGTTEQQLSMPATDRDHLILPPLDFRPRPSPALLGLGPVHAQQHTTVPRLVLPHDATYFRPPGLLVPSPEQVSSRPVHSVSQASSRQESGASFIPSSNLRTPSSS